MPRFYNIVPQTCSKRNFSKHSCLPSIPSTFEFKIDTVGTGLELLWIWIFAFPFLFPDLVVGRDGNFGSVLTIGEKKIGKM